MDSLIYTVGYQDLALIDLSHWVANTRAVVLDCRFRPWSRRPEWCLPHLIEMLGDSYLWMGRTLGNVCWNTDEVQLAEPQRGVRIASRILERRPICLLCLEADHWRCHRAQVADLIAEATGRTVQLLDAADLNVQGKLAF